MATENIAESAHEKIDIRIGDDEDFRTTSGLRHYLVFDPDMLRVDTWCNVGPGGMPMNVWHQRAVMFSIPGDAVTSELIQCVEKLKGDFLALADRYRGKKWDGSNWVGDWEDSEHDYDSPRRTLEDKIQDAISETPAYWDIGDWMSQASRSDIIDDIRRRMAAGKTMDEIVAEDVEGALINDAYIHEGKLHRAYTELLEECE